MKTLEGLSPIQLEILNNASSYVKVGGIFAAMKGPNEDISAAKNAVKILGGEIEKIHEYKLNGDGRMIITVRKISHTPSKYPRNSGQISKKNL